MKGSGVGPDGQWVGVREAGPRGEPMGRSHEGLEGGALERANGEKPRRARGRGLWKGGVASALDGKRWRNRATRGRGGA